MEHPEGVDVCITASALKYMTYNELHVTMYNRYTQDRGQGSIPMELVRVDRSVWSSEEEASGIVDASNAYNEYLDAEALSHSRVVQRENESTTGTRQGDVSNHGAPLRPKGVQARRCPSFLWPMCVDDLHSGYKRERTRGRAANDCTPSRMLTTKGADGYSKRINSTYQRSNKVDALFGYSDDSGGGYGLGDRNGGTTQLVYAPLLPPQHPFWPRNLTLNTDPEKNTDVKLLYSHMLSHASTTAGRGFIPMKPGPSAIQRKGWFQEVYCVKPCSHLPESVVSHRRSVAAYSAIEKLGEAAIVWSATGDNQVNLQFMRCLDDNTPPGHPTRGPDKGNTMENTQLVMEVDLSQDGHHAIRGTGHRAAPYLMDTYSFGTPSQWAAGQFGGQKLDHNRAQCLIRTGERASDGIPSYVVTFLMYPVLPDKDFDVDSKRPVLVTNTECSDMYLVVGITISIFAIPSQYYAPQAKSLMKWRPMTPGMTRTDPTETSFVQNAMSSTHERAGIVPWWNITSGPE